MSNDPRTDLVVIVPGIGGSQLVDSENRKVWTGRLGPAVPLGLRPRRALERLSFREDPGDGPAPDGVVAAGLLALPGAVSFFADLDGYDRLVEHVRVVLTARRPPPMLFAYDWRLSVRYNGRQLGAAVKSALDHRRVGGGEPRVTFVGHSMGGLVARWCIENVDGIRERCRRLITLGTPFRGAVKAVQALEGALGPRFMRSTIAEATRTFPGARQLLPTGPCIKTGEEFVTLIDARRAGLLSSWVADAVALHGEVSPYGIGGVVPYDVQAMVGTMQPTPLFIDGDEFVDVRESQPTLGDGTVSHGSARPPEWGDDVREISAGPIHASMQSSSAAHANLTRLLNTGRPAKLMSASSRPELTVHVPATAQPSESIAVRVVLQAPADLDVKVFDAERTSVALLEIGDGPPALFPPISLQSGSGDPPYEAVLPQLPEGLYRVRVGARAGSRQIAPIVSLLSVIAPD